MTDEDLALQQKNFDDNFRRVTTLRTAEQDRQLQDTYNKFDLESQLEADARELKAKEEIRKIDPDINNLQPMIAETDVLDYDPVTNSYYSTKRPTEEITGFEGINDLWLRSDSTYRAQELRHTTHERAKLSSFDFHYAQNFQEAATESGYLSADQANALVKKYNADITFKKPASIFEVYNSIETYRRKQALDYYSYHVSQTGSLSGLQNIGVLASGFTGAIGPMEASATIISSVYFPEYFIGKVAQGAGLMKNVMFAKKGFKTMEQAAAITNQARYANTIAKGAAGMGTKEADKAAKIYTKVVNPANQKLAEEDTLRLLKKLEDLEKLQGKYDALAPGAKAGVDALSLMAIDSPYIAYTHMSAKDMGQEDLYTLKDAASDFMVAGALGVGLPAAGRFLFKLTPSAYVSRQIDKAELNILEREALGRISEAEARKAHDTINELRQKVKETDAAFKAPNPKLVELSEGLRKSNLTDEEFKAALQMTYQSLLNGIRPKMHKIPFAGAMLSSISFEVLKQFRRNSSTVTDVFGQYLDRKVSKEGFHSVSVVGEEGMLGRQTVTALNEAEADFYLKELYRAYILKDKKAFRNFRTWSEKMNKLANRLEEIRSAVGKQQENNSNKNTGKKSKIALKDQINIRREVELAWMEYKLSREEYQQYLKYLDKNKLASISDADLIPEFMQEYVKDFNNFSEKYIFEQKKANGTAYDFKTASGGKATEEKQYHIAEYIKDLSTAARNNLELSELDNYFRNMSQEKVDEVIRAVTEYDVTADTDVNNLFGIQRRTHQEWEQIQKESDMQDMQVSIHEVNYDTLFESDRGKKLKSILIAYTDADKETKSRVNKAMLLIDSVREFKAKGLTDMQNTLVKSLYANESFQKTLQKALDKQNFSKGLELALRTHYGKALKELPIEKVMDDSELQDILDKMVERTMKLSKEDPEALRVLLPPEEQAKLEVEKAVNKEVSAKIEAGEAKGMASEDLRKIERISQHALKLDSLFKPVFLELRRELNRLQLQAMWDVTRYTEILDLMLNDPFKAPEILTGAATQTVYNFLGSKRSVEYMSKTSGAYVSDLRNKLKAQTAQTVSGKNLLEIYKDPKYAHDIMESLLAIKHGIAGTKNADTDRIAQMILDQEASFLGSFLRFGSDYANPINLLDRGKLRYIDAFVTNSEVDHLQATMAKNLSELNQDNIYKMLSTAEDGLIKYGTETYSKTDAKVINIITKILEDNKDIFSDVFRIHNPVYRKMALWAIRDLDLDKMFDPHHTALIGLNAVRDALLSGDWASVVKGDIGNLRNATIDLKRLKTILIGKEVTKIKIDGKELINPPAASWVYKFYTGLTDTGAITRETKAASVNAFEGNVHFKNFDTELAATKTLGYDSVPDYVNKSFSKMHQAYFCLERFGTRPIALVEELIAAFERTRKAGNPLLDKAVKDYRAARGGSDEGIGAKMGFTQNQVESVKEQVAQACGEQNSSPCAATRLINALVRFISSPLLVGAGYKSFSDYSTIWSGLIMNSLAEGRLDALKLTADASDVLSKNKDILDLVLATNIIESDTLLKKMLNDPSADLVALSENATMLDKLEFASMKYADFMLNSLGRMSDITNRNKQVAGLAIEMAIGKQADVAYNSMPSNLKTMLFRESITERDWEFIRTHMIHDVMEYTKRKADMGAGNEAFKGSSFKLLIPQSAMDITDDVIIKELQARGVKRFNKNTINNFRRDIMANAYNLVDTSADEMCSIPSNRIGYILRGGRAKGSGWGTAAEIVTQYMSFGCSILVNTYGRILSNALTGEVGITIMDLFNPSVTLAHHTRPEIFLGLFGHVMNIALTMMVVENAVKALQGNIQKPYDEHGIHLDNWILSPALGSMGLMGTLLDAVFTGIEGSGQRGGGFSMQVAPSISSVLRQAYRIKQPIASERVATEDKPKAVAAAIAQNVAGQFGIKSTPLIGPAYQLLVGDWLDMHIKGGYANYESSLKGRERRGQVVFDWTKDPQPFWDRFTNED